MPPPCTRLQNLLSVGSRTTLGVAKQQPGLQARTCNLFPRCRHLPHVQSARLVLLPFAASTVASRPTSGISNAGQVRSGHGRAEPQQTSCYGNTHVVTHQQQRPLPTTAHVQHSTYTHAAAPPASRRLCIGCATPHSGANRFARGTARGPTPTRAVQTS